MSGAIMDEVMKRFDILEEMGLCEEVRENYKEGITCYTEHSRLPWGEEIGINWAVDNDPRYVEVIETVKAKGWVPYYAVKTVFREIGELLSVFIISTNKDDMQMWGEDREWLRKGYARTYTHNFTYDFAECGDVVFRIAAGGAVRER